MTEVKKCMNLFILCIFFYIQKIDMVEKNTDEEKRLDDKYLNQFKGVEKIKNCIVCWSLYQTEITIKSSFFLSSQFEDKVVFFCPYYAADSVPPYPSKDKVKDYSECCGEKCCTKVKKMFILI